MTEPPQPQWYGVEIPDLLAESKVVDCPTCHGWSAVQQSKLDEALAATRMNLVGLHEVGQMIGVSRQRADQLARQVGFPKPVAELKAGRIWREQDIQRWIDARKVGSPS